MISVFRDQIGGSSEDGDGAGDGGERVAAAEGPHRHTGSSGVPSVVLVPDSETLPCQADIERTAAWAEAEVGGREADATLLAAVWLSCFRTGGYPNIRL